MKYSVSLFLFIFLSKMVLSQVSDSTKLVTLNQAIDSYVVSKNTIALDSLFASDFVFSHGSGRVEGKEGWMQTVRRVNYPVRQHDSVLVEMHNHVAVVKGKMNIEKQNKEKTDRYWLKYIRVYVRKNHWQLVSHSTIQEQHK